MTTEKQRPEHANKFVLASVKASLARIRLHPDDDVEDGSVDLTGDPHECFDMPPVDEDEMDGGAVGSLLGAASAERAREPATARLD